MAAGALGWVGAAAGRAWGWAAAVLVLLALPTRRLWLVVALVAGVIAGGWSIDREEATLAAEVPSGPVTVAGRMVDDPRPFGDQVRFRLEPLQLKTRTGWLAWPGPRLAVTARSARAAAGETVVVSGLLQSDPEVVRGDPVAGVIRSADVVAAAPPNNPLFLAGNTIRDRVRTTVGARGAAGALLSGFLVGDVARLPPADIENLRRAGLAHFVAVSGSNVALFLAVWFVAAGPLGWSPNRRAIIGLAGLALFLVVTRWEPSVVRASLMAGLLLLGRVGGIPLRSWGALGAAVLASVLVAPQLTGDVGFQLSVAATGGVLLGNAVAHAHAWNRGTAALAITAGAQGAVAPLMLWHFGSVPLLSPLTNLVAAPLVTLATLTGGAAVASGWRPVVSAALALSHMVLEVSRLAAGGPQLDVLGFLVATGAGLLLRFRAMRPLVALGAAMVLAFGLLPPARVDVPTAVILDIGQGDATLLLGPSGETVLVDGGPDPTRLAGKLRRYGVDHLDLVVATHGDLDHIGGLPAALTAYPVGTFWHPGHREGTDSYRQLLDLASTVASTVAVPGRGWTASLGVFSLRVAGPGRRYADINDESIVLQVATATTTLLLTGDIEAAAQRDLGPINADIFKVPHHGAATSDLNWLSESNAPLAVVSVGENDFGHPHPDVIAALAAAGSQILRTDRQGDIVLPLGP